MPPMPQRRLSTPRAREISLGRRLLTLGVAAAVVVPTAVLLDPLRIGSAVASPLLAALATGAEVTIGVLLLYPLLGGLADVADVWRATTPRSERRRDGGCGDGGWWSSDGDGDTGGDGGGD